MKFRKAAKETTQSVVVPRALHHSPTVMADAHRFTWHGTGKNLLEAKRHAIDRAKSSVCLETFLWEDSEVGYRFRSALVAAERSGVRVRIIVNAVGSFGLGRDYFDELVAAGGSMRWFNELRLTSFSFRDHRKLQAWRLRKDRFVQRAKRVRRDGALGAE